MGIRCVVEPESALPARTSDPVEDLRPRPRRHIVPENEILVRLHYIYGTIFCLMRDETFSILPEKNRDLDSRNIWKTKKKKNCTLRFKAFRERNINLNNHSRIISKQIYVYVLPRQSLCEEKSILLSVRFKFCKMILEMRQLFSTLQPCLAWKIKTCNRMYHVLYSSTRSKNNNRAIDRLNRYFQNIDFFENKLWPDNRIE